MGTYTRIGKIISHCKTSPENLFLGRVLVCWYPFPVWVVWADQEDILFHPCSLLGANSIPLQLFPHYSLPVWISFPGCCPCAQPKEDTTHDCDSVQGSSNNDLSSVVQHLATCLRWWDNLPVFGEAGSCCTQAVISMAKFWPSSGQSLLAWQKPVLP